MTTLDELARRAAEHLNDDARSHLEIETALLSVLTSDGSRGSQRDRGVSGSRWPVRPMLVVEVAAVVLLVAGVLVLGRGQDAVHHPGTSSTAPTVTTTSTTVVTAPGPSSSTASPSSTASSEPPTTRATPASGSTTSASPVASSFRVAYTDGQELRIADLTSGAITDVGVVPADPGFTPILLGRFGVATFVVEQGAYLYLFDTSVPTAGPLRRGPYSNVGIVLSSLVKGYWAADPVTDLAAKTSSWRLHDPEGQVVMSGAIVAPLDVIPIGAVDDGVVLMTMATGRATRYRFPGLGQPKEELDGSGIATSGRLVALVRSGHLWISDGQTPPRDVADLHGDAPAQTVGAGAFSPDGSRFAMALSRPVSPNDPMGVLTVDLTASSGAIADVPGFGVTWMDGRHLVVVGGQGPSTAIIDATTGAVTRSQVQLPAGPVVAAFTLG